LVYLRRFSVAIEVTEKTLAIFGSPLGKVVDKGFDRFATGIAKDGSSAEIGGKGLHEGGIEPMLTDQQAQTITQARLTVVMAIGSHRRRFTMIGSNRARGSRSPEFFDRAEADTIGLAESTVDGARLSDSHFGTVNQGRDIGRVGVPISNEAS
jgi:hypothetical protein